ncbi:hypothetical protein HMI56_004475 [Coelomomyces lativittatus]|nr:hypothetical protein HMI56_004475 [Coelomomyces lativittatus]
MSLFLNSTFIIANLRNLRPQVDHVQGFNELPPSHFVTDSINQFFKNESEKHKDNSSSLLQKNTSFSIPISSSYIPSFQNETSNLHLANSLSSSLVPISSPNLTSTHSSNSNSTSLSQTSYSSLVEYELDSEGLKLSSFDPKTGKLQAFDKYVPSFIPSNTSIDVNSNLWDKNSNFSSLQNNLAKNAFDILNTAQDILEPNAKISSMIKNLEFQTTSKKSESVKSFTTLEKFEKSHILDDTTSNVPMTMSPLFQTSVTQNQENNGINSMVHNIASRNIPSHYLERTSLLTSLLTSNDHSVKLFRRNFLKFSHLGGDAKLGGLTLFLKMKLLGNYNHSLNLSISSSATVEQVIGHAIYTFHEQSIPIPLSLDVHGWNLFLADDEDEEEEEEDVAFLPPLDMHQPIRNFYSTHFLLSPKVLLTIHTPTPIYFATNPATLISDIFHTMLQYLELSDENGYMLNFKKNNSPISAEAVQDLDDDLEMILTKKEMYTITNHNPKEHVESFSSQGNNTFSRNSKLFFSSPSNLQPENSSINTDFKNLKNENKSVENSSQGKFMDQLSDFKKYVVHQKSHFGFTTQECTLTLDGSFLYILPIPKNNYRNFRIQTKLVSIKSLITESV